MSAWTSACVPVVGLCRLQAKRLRGEWVAVCLLGVALPLLWQRLLVTRVHSTSHVRLLLGTVMISAFFMVARRVGCRLAADRVLGCQALLRTAGVGRCQYLVARSLEGLATAILPLLVLVIGRQLLSVPGPRGCAFVVPFGLTILLFLGIGFCLARPFRSVKGTAAAVNLLFLAMVSLCPILYPLDRVPGILGPAIQWVPFTAAVESLERAYRTGALGFGLGPLVGWAAIFVIAGTVVFPWRESSGGPFLGVRRWAR